jgi:phosphoadenosine phosphosulfate reductase
LYFQRYKEIDMIHQLDIYGKDKVQTAIERLQNLQIAFPKIKEEGYFLAFSGGKDSVVIKALADMAGVKYDAHYHVTSVDPPELVRFIKSEYPDVAIDKPRYPDDYSVEELRGKQKTMWNLIAHKNMPPTRLARYCCAHLKEEGGMGRIVITGVRWAESNNRKENQGLYTIYGKSKRLKKEISEKNANFLKLTEGGWC